MASNSDDSSLVGEDVIITCTNIDDSPANMTTEEQQTRSDSSTNVAAQPSTASGKTDEQKLAKMNKDLAVGNRSNPSNSDALQTTTGLLQQQVKLQMEMIQMLMRQNQEHERREQQMRDEFKQKLEHSLQEFAKNHQIVQTDRGGTSKQETNDVHASVITVSSAKNDGGITFKSVRGQATEKNTDAKVPVTGQRESHDVDRAVQGKNPLSEHSNVHVPVEVPSTYHDDVICQNNKALCSNENISSRNDKFTASYSTACTENKDEHAQLISQPVMKTGVKQKKTLSKIKVSDRLKLPQDKMKEICRLLAFQIGTIESANKVNKKSDIIKGDRSPDCQDLQKKNETSDLHSDSQMDLCEDIDHSCDCDSKSEHEDNDCIEILPQKGDRSPDCQDLQKKNETSDLHSDSQMGLCEDIDHSGDFDSKSKHEDNDCIEILPQNSDRSPDCQDLQKGNETSDLHSDSQMDLCEEIDHGGCGSKSEHEGIDCIEISPKKVDKSPNFQDLQRGNETSDLHSDSQMDLCEDIDHGDCDSKSEHEGIDCIEISPKKGDKSPDFQYLQKGNERTDLVSDSQMDLCKDIDQSGDCDSVSKHEGIDIDKELDRIQQNWRDELIEDEMKFKQAEMDLMMEEGEPSRESHPHRADPLTSLEYMTGDKKSAFLEKLREVPKQQILDMIKDSKIENEGLSADILLEIQQKRFAQSGQKYQKEEEQLGKSQTLKKHKNEQARDMQRLVRQKVEEAVEKKSAKTAQRPESEKQNTQLEQQAPVQRRSERLWSAVKKPNYKEIYESDESEVDMEDAEEGGSSETDGTKEPLPVSWEDSDQVAIKDEEGRSSEASGTKEPLPVSRENSEVAMEDEEEGRSPEADGTKESLAVSREDSEVAIFKDEKEGKNPEANCTKGPLPVSREDSDDSDYRVSDMETSDESEADVIEIESEPKSPPPMIDLTSDTTDTPKKKTHPSKTGGKIPKRDDDVSVKERRKERNRISARRLLQRRRLYITDLEKRVKGMTAANTKLQSEANKLREEALKLKQMLLTHRNCPVTRKQIEAAWQLKALRAKGGLSTTLKDVSTVNTQKTTQSVAPSSTVTMENSSVASTSTAAGLNESKIMSQSPCARYRPILPQK